MKIYTLLLTFSLIYDIYKTKLSGKYSSSNYIKLKYENFYFFFFFYQNG